MLIGTIPVYNHVLSKVFCLSTSAGSIGHSARRYCAITHRQLCDTAYGETDWCYSCLSEALRSRNTACFPRSTEADPSTSAA